MQREKKNGKIPENPRIVDNFKSYNVHRIGISEGKERQNRAEDVFEAIVANNFPKLITEVELQIQGAQRTPSKINAKNTCTQANQYAKGRKPKTEKILKKAGGKTHFTWIITRILQG